jgi:hypothetical protein
LVVVVVGAIVVVVVDGAVEVDLGVVVVVVVDAVVVDVVDVGVWAGTSGDDGPDDAFMTLAAAAVTPPTIRALAIATAASLRAGTGIRVGPLSPAGLSHTSLAGRRSLHQSVIATSSPLGDQQSGSDRGCRSPRRGNGFCLRSALLLSVFHARLENSFEVQSDASPEHPP